jgi:hypothetical protein
VVLPTSVWLQLICNSTASPRKKSFNLMVVVCGREVISNQCVSNQQWLLPAFGPLITGYWLPITFNSGKTSAACGPIGFIGRCGPI